jgi:phospholipid transport system substrate-binding protein
MSRALLLVALFCISLAPGKARAAAAPDAVVNEFHAALTDAMTHGAELGCKGRIAKLEPVIVNAFDLPFIASHILRKRWEKLTPEQRSAFTTTLKDLTVETYAGNFSHPGTKFETLEVKDLSPTRKQVRTRLIPSHDEPVSLDYFLQKSGDDWKIINVIANGVSDLALRSSQYDKVFEDSGFDGLMSKLHKQIEADLAACSAPT